MQSWTIGDVKVTKVVELETTSSATWILPDATPAALRAEAWLQPHFATAEGKATLSIHAFVLESNGRRIIVDTCIGNDKERLIPHPVQCAHTDWASSADVDPARAVATRRDFVQRCAASGVLVLGTHFAGPTAGHIVAHGEAHRLVV